MRKSEGTSRLLRELRSLRISVFHPDDQDGQELLGQLQRIGCQAQAFWPPLEKLPTGANLIILAMRPETLSMDLPWLRRDSSPPVIPVVNYENPLIVEAVLQLNAYGVIASPVRSFGLLTSIVVAVNQAEKVRDREKYVARLEQRLSGLRKVNKAKAILMSTRGVCEEDAYKIIRDQAMTKRVTAEEIADALINANEILGLELKP